MNTPDSPAARQRRRRARWKAGLGVVSVEVDWFETTEFLIQAGLLLPSQIDDRRKVGEALSLWIARRHA